MRETNLRQFPSRRWLSVSLAAIAFLSLLVGCEEKNAAPEEGAVQEEALLNKSGMPIVKQPLSLHFFTGTGLSNPYEDTLVWQAYAKMTNIQVQFDLVPYDALAAKRNLALSDGTYPDAFYASQLQPMELDQYGRQGLLIPLDDLIGRYAPNFNKLMLQYPEIRKGLTMSDGHIYSLPSFYDPQLLSVLVGVPLWVNQEWLSALGLQEPATVDEFYSYLKAVKNTDLNHNGMLDEIPYADNGISDLINQLKGAWGLGNRGLGHPFVDVDTNTNTLRFTRIQPSFKELLVFLNKLYKEGLLDKEIFTLDYKALLARGAAGELGSTIVPSPETLMNQKSFIGLGALKGPHGDQLYSQIKAPLAHLGAFAITDKNPNPAATLRWIDYFYGEEGATFFFMGKEGITYEKEADGELRYIETIFKQSPGLTHEETLSKYVTWLGGSYPGVVRANYFKGSETLPPSMEAAMKAEPYAVKEIWYNFNYIPEEQEIMSSIGQDIQDYIVKMEEKFINGTLPFTYWDQYVSDIKHKGLAAYMKVYNDAYERYKKLST